MRAASLCSSNGGISAFRSLIKCIVTRYFMSSTGKILFDFEIINPVNLGSIETCFYPPGKLFI